MSTIDTSVLELLASKICHDLISPIGAVNNGVEFMSEMGADAGDEAIGLIAYSAQQASAKLQAYRMAYGAGGADGSLKPEDVHKVIDAMVSADNKIKQNWDPYGELGYGDERPDAYCKMLVCTMLCAIECLPKGGEISITASDNASLITATGDNAAPREMMREALALQMHSDNVEPKHVHPYVTGLLANSYGFSISISETGENSVTLKVGIPPN